MRPSPVVDDEPVENMSYPHVASVSSPTRRPAATNGQRPRREPWTPRDDVELPIARQPEQAPVAPPRIPSTGATQGLRLAAIGIVCMSILAAIVTWRAVADVSGPPPPNEATPVATPQATEPSATGVSGDPSPAESRSGAITREVQELKPNYTVAPGDTLASIARRHGTTIEALASINRLENRNALSVGQKLILP